MFGQWYKATQMLPKDFFDAAESLTEYTPDSNDLFKKESHLLFVCDDLMRHCKDFKVIQNDAKFQARVYTVDNGFTLIKNDLGEKSFLIPLEQKPNGVCQWENPQRMHGAVRSTPGASLRGELFKIPPYSILNLDKRFENGYSYERKKISVIIPYRIKTLRQHEGWKISERMDGIIYDAFFYVGRRQYWDKLLDCGFQYKAVRCFNPKTGIPHYYYTTAAAMEGNERLYERLR